MGRYVIAVTGASGVVYGIRLIEELLRRRQEVHLIITEPAWTVIQHELAWELDGPRAEIIRKYLPGEVIYYDNSDIAARLASGSFRCDGMAVIPCTMSTIAAISHGSSKNLLERAADVVLKEKLRLWLVPRETPLNVIHLRNMLSLAEIGVHIIPAMPAFYSSPVSMDDLINFMVGKVLDAMGMDHQLFRRYEAY